MGKISLDLGLSCVFYIFILFHQTVVAKKHRHIHRYIHSHIQIYKYIRTNTNNIYTHTTDYVEAIELHDMADTLFHSLDKYKPNLTSNLCMRLANRTQAGPNQSTLDNV